MGFFMSTLSTSSCQFWVSVLIYFLHRKILMSVNFVSSTDKSCNRSETLSRSIQILAKLSTCTSHRSENFPDLLTIINRFTCKKTLKWLKNAERNVFCIFLLIYWITIYIKEMMIEPSSDNSCLVCRPTFLPPPQAVDSREVPEVV